MEITKEKLKKFLEHKNDTTLDFIIKEFNLNSKDILKLEIYLNELIKEEIIEKTFCKEHNVWEYDYIQRKFRGKN